MGNGDDPKKPQLLKENGGGGRAPPKVMAHPMESKYGREARKAEEARQEEATSGVQGQAGAQNYLTRLKGKKSFHFSDDGLYEEADEPFTPTPDTSEPEFSKEEIEAAVATINTSDDVSELHDAATVLREAASAPGSATGQLLLAVGGVQALMKLLENVHADESLQEDAAISILNLALNRQLKQRVADEGVLLPLVSALKAPHIHASSKANIASALFAVVTSEAQAVTLLTSGALNPLIDVLRTAALPAGTVGKVKEEGVQDALRALLRLTKFRPIRAELLKLGAVKHITDLAFLTIGNEELDVGLEVAMLLAIVTRVPGGAEALCIDDSGRAAEAVLKLMLEGGGTGGPKEAVADPALQALGQAARASVDCAEAMRHKGIPAKLQGAVESAVFSPEMNVKINAVIAVINDV